MAMPVNHLHSLLAAAVVVLVRLVAAVPTIDDLCADWMNPDELEVSAPLSSLRGGCISGSDVLSVGALTFPPFVLGTASEQVETGSLSDPLRPGHGD